MAGLRTSAQMLKPFCKFVSVWVTIWLYGDRSLILALSPLGAQSPPCFPRVPCKFQQLCHKCDGGGGASDPRYPWPPSIHCEIGCDLGYQLAALVALLWKPAEPELSLLWPCSFQTPRIWMLFLLGKRSELMDSCVQQSYWLAETL